MLPPGEHGRALGSDGGPEVVRNLGTQNEPGITEPDFVEVRPRGRRSTPGGR